MRIRKRHPPLPLSSLVPVPLPDPHLRPPPPVQLPGNGGAPPHSSSSPSLHPYRWHHLPDHPGGRLPSDRHSSDPVNRRRPDLLETAIDRRCHGGELKAKEEQISEERGEEEPDKLWGEAKERHNDFWEANMFGGSRSTNSEGRMAISLKKRRGNLFPERLAMGQTMSPVSADAVSCNEGVWDLREDGDGDGDWGGRGEKRTKKREGGAARRGLVEEGSRCSRMNGRGWRCCQPTLVGYSLCQHHLGKGRLRSIAAVQIRASLCGYNAAASSIAVATPGGDDDGWVRRPQSH